MIQMRIKELREEKGIAQREIAKILGCQQAGYSKWELQQRDIPNEALCQLADYYGVSTDYILGRTNKRKPYPTTGE